MDISAIKAYLGEQKLEAYLITYGNQFIGQDVLLNEHKLKYLCGFSGSAGIMAVTLDKTYLLVDGRYELQARLEVTSEDIIIINKIPSLKNVCEILAQNNINNIGYDAWNHSAKEMNYVRRCFPNMVFSDIGDLVSLATKEKIFVSVRDTKYSGFTKDGKIHQLCAYMADLDADYCLITSADSVSWLLNIYSRDLPYSPVVRAYALVDKKGNCQLISDDLTTDLFAVHSFAEFSEILQKISTAKILCDTHVMPEKIKTLVQKNMLIDKPDICRIWKSQKNNVEIQGMIDCHIRDGVAVSKLLCWLEQNWQGKSELDVVQKLHALRAEQQNFFSESFASIVASAEHGAIVHYQPNEKTNMLLQDNSLLLIDSGGQYFDGTTDVTRTIVLGKPSKAMIKDFTTVLKAHISLATAIFPLATSGKKLDVLARSKVWQYRCDYKHGTGHGVACFGNVHEGPVSISPSGDYGLMPNMVVSIEPGIYRENKYGIRIENLVYSKNDEMFSEDLFLCFKSLTKIPIDKRLIDTYLLDVGERAWLNAYHKDVYECLAPFMNENEKLWLKDACSPL